jgi:hypothetical protein
MDKQLAFVVYCLLGMVFIFSVIAGNMPIAGVSAVLAAGFAIVQKLKNDK